MPTHKQNTTEAVVTTRGFGKSDTNAMRAAFSNSPLHNGEWSDADLRAFWVKKIQIEPINDGGHTFTVFNQNFVEAPSPEDVEVGGGGLPAGPFVPTTASPGVEGSINPSDLPEVDPTPRTNIYGSGPGISLRPSESSRNIATRSKLGEYLSGKSGGISE